MLLAMVIDLWQLLCFAILKTHQSLVKFCCQGRPTWEPILQAGHRNMIIRRLETLLSGWGQQ